MKDLEDLYMENVFPRNYNLKNTVNPEVNDDLVEKEIMKLRDNLLKSYHLLITPLMLILNLKVLLKL